MKAREKKLLGHDMQHYHNTGLEEMRENTLIIYQKSRCAGRDIKPEPQEYKAKL
jgi:hypothetical protein